MEQYFITDIETGYKIEVTKRQYESYIRMMEYFRPHVEDLKGSIIVFGTSGDMEMTNNDIREMFYNPENYK
jgi:hypothetical protein